MSEFSDEQFCVWVELSLGKRCSLYKAIGFDLYWLAVNDPEIVNRAHKFAENEFKDILAKRYDLS